MKAPEMIRKPVSHQECAVDTCWSSDPRDGWSASGSGLAREVPQKQPWPEVPPEVQRGRKDIAGWLGCIEEDGLSLGMRWGCNATYSNTNSDR